MVVFKVGILPLGANKRGKMALATMAIAPTPAPEDKAETKPCPPSRIRVLALFSLIAIVTHYPMRSYALGQSTIVSVLSLFFNNTKGPPVSAVNTSRGIELKLIISTNSSSTILPRTRVDVINPSNRCNS